MIDNRRMRFNFGEGPINAIVIEFKTSTIEIHVYKNWLYIISLLNPEGEHCIPVIRNYKLIR